MRDYVRELTEVWRSEGEQAAYLLVSELHRSIRNDIAHLHKQGAAIQALAAVLKDYPSVDTSADPIDDDAEEAQQADAAGSAFVDPSKRSDYIFRIAEFVSHSSNGEPFSTQDVLDEIYHRFATLGVRQPLAVIGTVLSSAKGFTRIAPNTYQSTDSYYSKFNEKLPF